MNTENKIPFDEYSISLSEQEDFLLEHNIETNGQHIEYSYTLINQSNV